MPKISEQNAEVFDIIMNSGKSLLQLYIEAKKDLEEYKEYDNIIKNFRVNGGMGK